ncbi:MAG: ComEA family DNA-binding protein [Candidatus Omnitrophica bacterium]|nr:ComEA family DNA-binding protein [Candidatus Omnitrophota bacterium]
MLISLAALVVAGLVTSYFVEGRRRASFTLIRAEEAAELEAGRTAIETQRLIHINSAETGTLELLPGIGPALALRIVEWRTAHGSFRHPEDLLNVRGIGPRLLEKISGKIVFD